MRLHREAHRRLNGAAVAVPAVDVGGYDHGGGVVVSGAGTEVAFLTRALKMPRAWDVVSSLADQARDEGWDYQEFLAKVLAEEQASRELHGGDKRIRAAGKSHPHAARILARTWTQIIWRCWQDRVPYNPAHHRALQHLQREGGLI